jgi:hypothetical protein
MKKNGLVAWLLLPMLVVAIATPVRADDDPRIRAYEQQLDRMQKEMDEMRARLRALEQERGKPAREPAAAAPAPAPAAPVVAAPAVGEQDRAEQDRAEQDRKIGVLATEVDRLKRALVLPEHKELKSMYGLGPAASKVYQVDRGLSIGGYGEYNFQKYVSDQQGRKDRFDLLRFILYTGYKFNDWILLNAELEFEHALTSSTISSDPGVVEIEFAYLDFLFWQQFNVRAGLLLVPLGFINEIHEPPFFHGVLRPETERSIIPTTWREGGVGFFGSIVPGLEYRAYLMNGLNAEGYSAGGIRGGRQSGNRALAEDFAGAVRVDYTPFGGTLVGASFFAGDAGQSEEFDGEKANAFTLLWEAHAQFRYRGLELRALGAMTSIDDADVLSRALEDTIAEDVFGFYAEAAYDVLPLVRPDTTHYLAPFFRYEIFDTQDKVPSGFTRVAGNDVQLYTVGLDYKPHPQVVLKLEYRNFNAGGNRPRADEFNLGAGFVF